MDDKLLMDSANELDHILRQYAEFDDEAKTMLRIISPLIQDALSGKIITPFDWRKIPGIRFYAEGNLQRYNDLGEALATFKEALNKPANTAN